MNKYNKKNYLKLKVTRHHKKMTLLSRNNCPIQTRYKMYKTLENMKENEQF